MGLNERNIIEKVFYGKYFQDMYIPIVVLANPKTILKDKYASKQIKNQVIRADQLISYIRKAHASDDISINEDAMVKIGELFLEEHKKNENNYNKKYEDLFNSKNDVKNDTENVPDIICSRCGSKMILRKANRGIHSGNDFYGCSKYPKCRNIINIKSNSTDINKEYIK
jgi:hypothetical protein